MRTDSRHDDERWMQVALALAREAAQAGDVPVGAVAVAGDGTLLATGRNRREEASDPTAHAEMNALREAARKRGSWRLTDASIYVTLEPCVMCAGALVQARVRTVVFGCLDEKAGAMGSLFVIGQDPRLSHRIEIRRGVLAEPSAALLREFFRARRPD